MAAEMLAARGIAVDVYDAMPSVGRKFLLAGIGGMNITHSEPAEPFLDRYGAGRVSLQNYISAFDADALQAWIHALGIETFVGSSGRVFPKDMKAAPLLRAWLARLKAQGVAVHPRHRWLGWGSDGALRFATPDGEISVRADTTVLALGGASWARLGSDGAWAPLLAQHGVEIAPLQPANCGFEADWSAHLQTKFAGSPLKSVALTLTDVHGNTERRIGEFVVSQHGVEGSLIYAFSARIRELIAAQGEATIHVDLSPQRDAERVLREVSQPRGSRSLSSHLQSKVGIDGVKAALLRECVSKDDFNDMTKLAAAIKALPITLRRPRPIDEAISTAGGVAFAALDGALMLKALPGVFCAGEMLDWEAPTGGYLLTACFATGRAAGLGAANWLQQP
ncbi:hypothetical protein SAMN02745857_03765 [Andreprevotia lacus DSM 23236]|jgi:uncharacterized flavoprotein (TIGR03862 family)|uniref:TIGR03862 family flavoprotein n=2 Tax=Andreprevotia TaxID=397275 RepID=A0A1W1XZH7_9NEIS|nr:hypothetical protein SAMN02745857_03765 [Andreprevotia lacus DSM 23236]